MVASKGSRNRNFWIVSRFVEDWVSYCRRDKILSNLLSYRVTFMVCTLSVYLNLAHPSQDPSARAEIKALRDASLRVYLKAQA
jgi:hypothetical protein